MPHPADPSFDKRSLKRLRNPSCLRATVDFVNDPLRVKNTIPHWFVGTLPLSSIEADHSIPFKALQQNISQAFSSAQSLYLHHHSGALWAWYDEPSSPNTPKTPKKPFERQTALRKSLMPLLTPMPSEIALSLIVDSSMLKKSSEALWKYWLEETLYIALVNTLDVPSWKQTPSRSCQKIFLSLLDPYGHLIMSKPNAMIRNMIHRVYAVVEGQALCRALSMLPSNILTPYSYRRFLHDLATQHQYTISEWDEKRLKQHKAGAFLAVAQGHDPNHSAIVRLEYQHPQKHQAKPEKKARLPILIGKGVCFDTGGNQIKPAKAMMGMHQDMNGSAVALGLFYTLTQLQLFPQLEVYLAIADNVIGPKAYRPNDVVEAINGKTIEIVHTDAEGRMLLADTLALISQILSSNKDKRLSALMIDFATLTGAMISAVGCRMSGAFGNNELLNQWAKTAGEKSGERLCFFPMPEDYSEGLRSNIADILQCRINGDADHIYAALFLQSFVDNHDWLHIDLSASECEDGLGAVGHQITGFGVRWGLTFFESLIEEKL